MKIGQHLVKLWVRVGRPHFLDSRGICARFKNLSSLLIRAANISQAGKSIYKIRDVTKAKGNKKNVKMIIHIHVP